MPKAVIKKYIDNKTLKNEINQILKTSKVIDPLNYKYDNSFKRKIWLFVRKFNYIKKYKNNKW